MCWGPASVVLISRIPFHFPVPSSRPQGICRVHGCCSCSEGLSSQDCPCSPLEPRPHGPFPAKQVQLMCPWWGVLHGSPFSIATSDFKYELPRAWLHPVRKVSVPFSCAFSLGKRSHLFLQSLFRSPQPRGQKDCRVPQPFFPGSLGEEERKKRQAGSVDSRSLCLKILPPHSTLGGVLTHACPQPRMQGSFGWALPPYGEQATRIASISYR